MMPSSLTGAVANDIHFEVSWRHTPGGMARSIYVKKPPHYLIYQLLLDIQARTGFHADRHELTFGGVLLHWHQCLGSAGVGPGDVLVLKGRSSGTQAHAAPAALEYSADSLADYLESQLSLVAIDE
jgi:hypothetical protein